MNRGDKAGIKSHMEGPTTDFSLSIDFEVTKLRYQACFGMCHEGLTPLKNRLNSRSEKLRSLRATE